MGLMLKRNNYTILKVAFYLEFSLTCIECTLELCFMTMGLRTYGG